MASAPARSPGLGSACTGCSSERRHQAFDHAAPAPARSAGAKPSTAARQVTRSRSAAFGIRNARAMRGHVVLDQDGALQRDAAALGIAAGARHLEAADLDVVGAAGSARCSPSRDRPAATPSQIRRVAVPRSPGSDLAVDHDIPGQHARAHVDRAPARHPPCTISMPLCRQCSRSTASAATWLRPSSTHSR